MIDAKVQLNSSWLMGTGMGRRKNSVFLRNWYWEFDHVSVSIWTTQSELDCFPLGGDHKDERGLTREDWEVSVIWVYYVILPNNKNIMLKKRIDNNIVKHIEPWISHVISFYSLTKCIAVILNYILLHDSVSEKYFCFCVCCWNYWLKSANWLRQSQETDTS